jgi:imidazolonepropionase-like amidohydrolase
MMNHVGSGFPPTLARFVGELRRGTPKRRWREGGSRIHCALALCTAVFLALPARADAPHVYAIVGGRIVPAVGASIDNGIVLVRQGVIEAVGAFVPVPADARVIEAKGLTIYPGLVDLSNRTASEPVTMPAPQSPRTREEVERWKRGLLLQPQQIAARRVRADLPELTRLAAAGITSALALPAGEVFKGQSALVNVVAPDDEPQIGGLADQRRGRIVVRTPVALHVAVPARPRGGAYPVSLMGVIAFVRQAFLDAQHYQQAHARYARIKSGVERPVYDEALEALQPALSRTLPVVFEASLAREISRALAMAAEFKLDPIIDGGLEADDVADELRRAGARVIVSLNYPTRPRALAPDGDEPIRNLRARAGAPRAAERLRAAGVLFGFGSAGLREPKDFVKNAAAAVKAGLPADAALRALTIDAAAIAGAADRLGSIERGKIANLLVTDGDLFDEKMTIKHVFVDGRLVRLE